MESLLESLSDPHSLHAMLVHLPIMLGVLGVLPLAALCVSRFRSGPLRALTVAWFLALSASAGAAAMSGNSAAANLGHADPPLAQDERAAVAVHEHRGERAWIWPLIPAAFVLASGSRRWRAAAGAGAVLASVGVAVWFGVIAHAGGRLVYARGLGVPERAPVREAALGP